MKKQYKIILVVILIIMIALCGLTYYRFAYYNADYLIIDISKEKRINNIDYISEYSKYKYDNSIDKEELLRINTFSSNDVFKGYFEIKNNYLYLVDNTTNESKKIINETCRSIAIMIDDETDKFSNAYIIGKSGYLYELKINSSSLDDIEVYKVFDDVKFDSFLEIGNFYSYKDKSDIKVAIFDENNNIRIIPDNILYEPGMFIINNELIIYSDGKVTTFDGKKIKDSNKNEYIINYFVEIIGDNPFLEKPKFIMITDKNKIIYILDNKIYEYKKTIKKMLYKYEEDEKYTFSIEFEDNSKIDLLVTFDYYYGLR